MHWCICMYFRNKSDFIIMELFVKTETNMKEQTFVVLVEFYPAPFALFFIDIVRSNIYFFLYIIIWYDSFFVVTVCLFRCVVVSFSAAFLLLGKQKRHLKQHSLQLCMHIGKCGCGTLSILVTSFRCCARDILSLLFLIFNWRNVWSNLIFRLFCKWNLYYFTKGNNVTEHGDGLCVFILSSIEGSFFLCCDLTSFCICLLMSISRSLSLFYMTIYMFSFHFIRCRCC